MALNKNKDHKLYYSIGEVAAELGVNESTLRYWETVFKQIAPKKGEACSSPCKGQGYDACRRSGLS